MQDTKGAEKASFRGTLDLVVAYFKQETLEPLKGVIRYLGFGLLGSLVVGIGSLFLVLGVLRLLQSETGTAFGGHLSWVPYLLTFALGLVYLTIVFLTAFRKRKA